MLVEEFCPVAKNSTDFSRGVALRLICRVNKGGNRAVVQAFTGALDGESGIPFAHINKTNDFKHLDGNGEFVGLHVGIEVEEAQIARPLAAGRKLDSNWTLISAPQKPQGMLGLAPEAADKPIQEAKDQTEEKK